MSPTAAAMTREDLSAIRSTFAVAARPGNGTAARFYAVLFRLDPSLRSLFHGDIHSQGEKFISMLALIVSNLENLTQLLPTLRQLGQRHAGYGVKEAHYATVGVALLETLREETGAAWSPEAGVAWGKAYALLAKNMTGNRAASSEN
jgi:hemoglobin-like flavoprotein